MSLNSILLGAAIIEVMALGALLASPFGSLAMFIGGVIGILVGNELVYHLLKSQKGK